MDSLKDYIKENNIKISIKYFGVNDCGTEWEVKNIIDNIDGLYNYYNNVKITEINNLDDYYFCLLSYKITLMEEIIPHLNDDIKVDFEKFVNTVKSIISNVKQSNIIKYINNNYKTIFNEESTTLEIKLKTLDIIAHFNTGIKSEVIKYICNSNASLIIYNFDKLQIFFDKNPSLFNELFPSGNLSEIIKNNYSETLKIWVNLYNRTNSKFKEIISSKIDTLYEDIVVAINNVDLNTNNIISIERITSKFFSALKEIKHPKAFEFKGHAKKAEELINKYLEKNGKPINFQIPIEEIISDWSNLPAQELKLLYITHDIQQLKDKVEIPSALSDIPKTKNITDLFTESNYPTDDYFTLSYQHSLSITASIRLATLFHITNDDDLSIEFFNALASCVNFVSEELSFLSEDIMEDTDVLINMIHSIIKNRNLGQFANATICYGTEMFICALTEKLLRSFYFYLTKEEVYIPSKKATLGQLLSTENQKIVDIFGIDHIKNLSYFLITCNEIGYNTRNKLAHLENISVSDFNIRNTMLLLWIFLDILNTISLYFMKDK